MKHMITIWKVVEKKKIVQNLWWKKAHKLANKFTNSIIKVIYTRVKEIEN